jgi:hypothetical protein
MYVREVCELEKPGGALDDSAIAEAEDEVAPTQPAEAEDEPAAKRVHAEHGGERPVA